jgi:hypothetical protein
LLSGKSNLFWKFPTCSQKSGCLLDGIVELFVVPRASAKSGEHPKFRVTTAHVERASQKIHSLSLPIHITLSNITICPFQQKRTVYFHATQ